MLKFAVNHMTVARASFAQFLEIASELDCIGVEVRNDLPQSLFDGQSPEKAGDMARERGLRILAISEIKRFNDWNEDRKAEALELIGIAKLAGAEAVSLIPRNDNGGMGNGERQANLRVALRELGPVLQDNGMTGLVEPLGFETCALRHKQEAVEAIEGLGMSGTFKLVHDTFHHHLARGGPVFAAHTGIVHVSGVVDPALSTSEMADENRILVDSRDRLGNIEQLNQLCENGYDGPVSFEAFAEEVHADENPVAALRQSMEFIRSGMADMAA